ncbi:MAG: VacJ family lipoprotein [Gammaproteobacteria bacterium]|nr:VacJ family lipoprotein [Gammaproteobacteria bacterium]
MPMAVQNKNNNPSQKFCIPRVCLIVAAACLFGLNACATTTNRTGAESGPAESGSRTGAAALERNNNNDPLEGFNRAMYKFNEKADQYVLKPVAKGYRAITPKPVSKSISNFFSNLYDPANMLYNFFQGKPKAGLSDLGRFVFNTTFGIAGLFDVATPMGFQKHDEDFGQTLAVWGVGEGPYLVLPFFGPSNIRDGASLPVDWYTYPPNHMEEQSTRAKMFVVEVVDRRAQLLDASDILEQAGGQDPYAFVRAAFRQRRLSQIYDGNPPQPPPPPGLFEDDEPAPNSPDKPAPGTAPQSR